MEYQRNSNKLCYATINIIVFFVCFFRYPVSLEIGIHTLRVIPRLKGPGSIKCSLKISKNVDIQILSEKILNPDIVDGNLFSEFFSIPITNLNAKLDYALTKIEVHSHSVPGFKELNISFENQIIRSGQTACVIFRISNQNSQEKQLKCMKSTSQITLKLVSGTKEFKNHEITINLRCRASTQSFLFTFLDHDGSIQHAATVKPLKDCIMEKCPVVLTNHGTGIYIYM